MRIVYPWLLELVRAPGTPESIAHEISLRGFEVASVEPGSNAVIDFEITANRPDCMSHLGIAREASAIWGLPLQMPALSEAEGPALSAVEGPALSEVEGLDVTIEAPDLCPRYCAQVFEVKVGPSPQWLADRLTAAGVRPISNIVDVTNYVLLELGQPMHAFDLERLAKRSIVVRRARPGERLKTLDGVERIARARHARHRRRRARERRRRRDGRSRLRDRAGDDAHRARERLLSSAVDPAHEQAAGPEDRSGDALRARRRRRRGADSASRARPRSSRRLALDVLSDR